MSWRNGTKFLSGRRSSIAVRLTVWYALLSVVLIASAGSVLYWVLANQLQQENDQLLTGKIAEIRATLTLHPQDYAALREAVQNEAETLPGIFIRVLNAQAEIIADSSGSNLIFAAREPFVKRPLPINGLMDWDGRDQNKYRQMSSRSDAHFPFTIYAAMNLSNEAQLLDAYRRTLLLSITIALAIAIAAGYFIARREIKPASRLAAIVDEIGARHLHRRVADEAWPSELQPLATNFDHLLTRLEDSFIRISRFSADIAHELRTPLHILRGEAEITLSKERSKEDYRACIESALDEYARLSHMVDALLFLARTEQPATQLDKKLLNCGQEVASVCAFYQAMADESEVHLMAQGTGNVSADSGLLRRALGNLVANALHHTPHGGQIDITVNAKNDAIQISVSDTGSGIAPVDLPHVLERFYRADGARSRHGQGTGLGLAIVQSIMHLHNGAISIHSEIDHGTTVILTFPSATD